MTDNEIIKALECCQTGTCVTDNCPLLDQRDDEHRCIDILLVECKHLIKRQKAEIEELKKGIIVALDYFASEYDEKIKAEAVKDFAERLEENLGELFMVKHSCVGEIIDNLLKETVGDAE